MHSKLLTLISVAVLSIASLVSAAGQAAVKSRPIELILHNGLIWTVDSKNTVAQALAISDGKFVLVGSNQAVLRLRGPREL